MRRHLLASLSGFTLIEVLMAISVLSILTGGTTYVAYGRLRRSSDNALINDEAVRLNRALNLFVTTGGIITGGDDGPTVLLKLQTPLTSSSAQSTGALHALIPPNYDFQAYSANDGMGRLVWTGSKYQMQTFGAGYRPVRLAVAKALTPVTRTQAGQQFGTTSKWVWEYTDSGAQGMSSPPSLSIGGPGSVTTPGTYTWTLTSGASGPLTLVLRNGQQFTATGTSLAQSAAFTYGDSFTFTAVGSYQPADQTSSRTVMLPVTVNIPISALSVGYAREDTTASTNFTYAQVTTSSTAPAVRNGIVLTVAGSPSNVTIYYTYDGSEPSTSSQVYSGPFHVPVSAWASSISLKAVAISTNGQYRSGPVTTVTLTPTKITLAAPTFTPTAAAPIMQGSSVSVAAPDGASASTRTALGASPIVYSSSATSFVLQ